MREVSETSRDSMMGDTISSDASAIDVDSHGQSDDDGSTQAGTVEDPAVSAQPAAEEQSMDSLGATGLSGSSSSAPRTLLGAEAPPGLHAIEDIKPDEYYQASDQIREALLDLPEQLQQSEESQLAKWVHTTEGYPDNLWMDCEYAKKACTRTGARVNFDVRPFGFGAPHPHALGYRNAVVIHDLLPYLDATS